MRCLAIHWREAMPFWCRKGRDVKRLARRYVRRRERRELAQVLRSQAWERLAA